MIIQILEQTTYDKLCVAHRAEFFVLSILYMLILV